MPDQALHEASAVAAPESAHDSRPTGDLEHDLDPGPRCAQAGAGGVAHARAARIPLNGEEAQKFLTKGGFS
jgi:hypothetical protein